MQILVFLCTVSLSYFEQTSPQIKESLFDNIFQRNKVYNIEKKPLLI